MSDPKHPVPGDPFVDASDVTLVPLTTEQIVRLTKAREGLGQAIHCLTLLAPEHIQQGGINVAEIERVVTLKKDLDRVDELLPAAERLADLLRETKLYRAHQIGLILSEIAAQVRRRAERDPIAGSVLGPLEDLLDYVSGPAQKAAAKRTKMAKEDAEASGEAPGHATSSSAPQPVSP